jgi:uncharacterized membrane protein YkvA (DUF1232 family)
MTLSVQFDLDEADLKHFRERMQDVCARTDCQAGEQIVTAAAELVSQLRATQAPAYVLKRLDTLDTLIAMSRDSEWQLPETEAMRVRYALAYFTDPGGLIPDETPGLGYMDDAIMIELVAKELSHEISAYEDFCAFRDAESALRSGSGASAGQVTRRDWLDAKRAELQRRMRRESGGLRSLYSLFSAG